MLTQPLLDKLVQLRLPAFRAALEEQLHNPQYADLPFEDRLGLLIDREWYASGQQLSDTMPEGSTAAAASVPRRS